MHVIVRGFELSDISLAQITPHACRKMGHVVVGLLVVEGMGF